MRKRNESGAISQLKLENGFHDEQRDVRIHNNFH